MCLIDIMVRILPEDEYLYLVKWCKMHGIKYIICRRIYHMCGIFISHKIVQIPVIRFFKLGSHSLCPLAVKHTHNLNQAHGLSFSVLPSQKDIPPSLQNIYKELNDDLGCEIPNNGYLKKWADQGVLLLNTVLTVRAHQANSHQGHGWEKFTDAIIEAVNEQDRPIVYMLWGRPAQSKIPMLTNPKHLILTAPHPSPL